MANPKMGVVSQAFRGYKRPRPDCCRGWDTRGQQIPLLFRQVRRDEDALSVDQMRVVWIQYNGRAFFGPPAKVQSRPIWGNRIPFL